MRVKVLLTGLFILFQFVLTPVYAGNFTPPPYSPVLMHLAGSLSIMGEPAEPGDEIAVFDNRGNIVGYFVVNTRGTFGDIPISGDVGLTEDVEGAKNGESLTIKVWRQSDNMEYSEQGITFSQPESEKGIYIPFPYETFSFVEGFYLMNIDVR